MHLFIFKEPSKHQTLRHLSPLKDKQGQKKKTKIEVWVPVQIKKQILLSQVHKKSENPDSHQKILIKMNWLKLMYTHTWGGEGGREGDQQGNRKLKGKEMEDCHSN